MSETTRSGMIPDEWRRYANLAQLVREGEEALAAPIRCIADERAALSPGGPNDYYSNGDYWWPNPETEDGLPYVRRDGESNPGNFHSHRLALRYMRTQVVRLAAAYRCTGDERYAVKAVRALAAFFVEERSRMNPHLLYAQAIPGVCTGRGIGIIDTLHLIDIPQAIQALDGSQALTLEIRQGLYDWFARYLEWMNTHEYGIAERNEPNNHGICWHVQAAAFARFTGDRGMLAYCREQYMSKLLPEQMAPDGSFPRELARTKPYAYSLFALDNMATLCQLLSTPERSLWEFELPDGRGLHRGLAYLYPYVANKAAWPYPPDVEEFVHWPVAMSFMLFAGIACRSEEWLRLWRTLNQSPTSPEVRRNMAIRQPLLWV